MSALIWPGALWWLVAGLAIWLITSLVRLDKTHPKPMRPGMSHLDEAHHGYYGLLLVVGILLAATAPPWLTLTVFAAGLLLAFDDVWQHWMQAARNPEYRSPAWRAYRWLLKLLD